MLEAIRAGYGAFEALLSRLSPGQMVQTGVEGVWSVKDILAHIVAWQQEMVGWLEQISRGELPEWLMSTTDFDVHQWNHQAYLKNRGMSLDEAQDAFGRAFDQALGTVAVTPEEILLESGRFPRLGDEPLWHVVAANTWWHYEEHGESIRAWLEAQ